MPTARRCSGCGAALGEPTDDDLTVVCRFCGLRHDINDLAGLATPIVVQVRPAMRRASAGIILGIIGFIAAVVGLGLYASYRTATEVTSRVQQVTSTVQQRLADARRVLPLQELASFTDRGWKDVDATPPPGGFSAFDPVAALPWAQQIAHAWAADAELTRIDVGRVSATGAVDLTGEETSGYRFRSPARERRWTQETDAGSKSRTTTAMLMQVRGSGVRVLLDDDRRNEPAMPQPSSLPLTELLDRARRGKGFADRPFYAGYMIHLPREGWVWYFRSPSGDSFPRVRARDGRVYPY